MVTQAPVKLWLAAHAMSVMREAEICDERQRSRGVGEVGDKFDVAPSLALAVRNARILDAMSRAEKVSKL